MNTHLIDTHDTTTQKMRLAVNLFHKAFNAQVQRFGIVPPANLESLVEYHVKNSIVFSLMDWKAKKTAMVKPNLFKVKSVTDAKEYRKWNGLYLDGYEKRQLKQLANIAFDEIDLANVGESSEYYKLKKLLTKPNPYMTFSELLGAYSNYMDGTGFSLLYSRKVASSLHPGRTVELYALPSQLMTLSGTTFKPITGYNSHRFPGTGKEFPAKDVMHIKTFSFDFDGLGTEHFGTSKINVAIREIMTYAEALDREYYGFKTGDTATVLMPKDVNRLPTEFKNKKGLLAFADMVRKVLRQRDRHNVGVINTALEAIKIDNQLKESITLEAKKEIREVIASVWHLSNRVVLNSSSGSTYNNIREEIKTSLRDGVFPDLINLGETLNNYEIYPNYPGHELAWDFDVYPELVEDRKAAMKSLKDADYLSDNQKLAELGYPPIADERANIPMKYWPKETAENPIS